MVRLSLLTSMIVIATVPLSAQQTEEPAIAIKARVRAQEIRFAHVPRVLVTFRGSVNGLPNATVHETHRENIPETVEPDVTYRNVGMVLTITSTLPEIDAILADIPGVAPPAEAVENHSAREPGMRRSDEASDMSDGGAAARVPTPVSPANDH